MLSEGIIFLVSTVFASTFVFLAVIGVETCKLTYFIVGVRELFIVMVTAFSFPLFLYERNQDDKFINSVDTISWVNECADPLSRYN